MAPNRYSLVRWSTSIMGMFCKAQCLLVLSAVRGQGFNLPKLKIAVSSGVACYLSAFCARCDTRAVRLK
jgi:hypothetical protein